MEGLKGYYTENSIVKLLCSYRAKHSHRRHKLHMMREVSLHKKTNKIEIKSNNPEFEILQKIFPSRRNWIKLNEKERKIHNNNVKRASARLYKTYKLYKKKNLALEESAIWFQNLIKFVNDILESVENSDSYEMKPPKIIGIVKKVKIKETEYRPITLYELKDRLISSILAKYLTDFFDSYFFVCSFAFRSTKGEKKYSHHKSIEEIVGYRKNKNTIWVSECDIQKFFDTVNQEHILNVFKEHIRLIEIQQSKTIDNKALMLFIKFLNSFAFNKDVFIKNTDEKWKKENNLKSNGYFKWIEENLIQAYGLEYLEERIGVPQGNAISCFISNLLLHNVDAKVLNVDKDIFYVRFCDDMVLMHPNKEICKQALEVYKLELKNNYLSYHKPTECLDYLNKENCKKFWDSKSKEPYLWGNPKNIENAIPWLSFVGYQIKYNQDIRIRKQSIEKEKRKQVKQVQDILESIGYKENNLNITSRKSKRQIVFSLQQRLHSMSVGRIKLHSYKHIKQGFCWTNGFELIKGHNNVNISKQLKELDSFREKQIWRLSKELEILSKQSVNPNFPEDEDIYYGSPYSYHNYLHIH